MGSFVSRCDAECVRYDREKSRVLAEQATTRQVGFSEF